MFPSAELTMADKRAIATTVAKAGIKEITFLNRIDKIVQFNPLSDDVLFSIVKLECAKFTKRMNELNFEIEFEDTAYQYIHNLALKEKQYGARPILRIIQDNIEDKITELLLENEFEKEYKFRIKVENNEIIIE